MHSVDELVDVVLGGTAHAYVSSGTLASPVSAARIDVAEEGVTWHAGEVVLSATVADQTSLDVAISRGQNARIAALVVRDFNDAHADTSIAVIRVKGLIDWSALYDRFKTALRADGAEWLDDPGDDGVGELFALANALGESIGSAVIIEDRQMRLLAFSEGQTSADASRIDTILRRRPSEAFIEHFKSSGVATRLYRGLEPVFLERTVDLDEEGLPLALHSERSGRSYVESRAAVGIRAGHRELGAIWIATAEPLLPHARDELMAAAKVAALHILRYEAFSSRTYQRRRELFSRVLWSHPSLAEAWASLLQRPARWFCVVAIRAPRREDDGRWAEDAVVAETQFKTRALNAYFCTFDDVCYGLVTTSDPVSRQGVVRAAQGYLGNRRSESAVGIGGWVSDPSGLSRSRTEADAALDVADRQHGRDRASLFGDVQMDALLVAIERSIDVELYVPAPALQALADHDTRTGANLVETLTLYIDSLGSVSATAAHLHVHVNTLRHRLTRIQAISGLDFDEPGLITRLSIQLYLLARQE